MNLVDLAASKGVWICFAESLTAGALSAQLVQNPGASKVFLGSVVAYQDEVKSQLLGVSDSLIASRSAVDAEVAIEMAVGARDKFSKAKHLDPSSVIAISTTGVAGPDFVRDNAPGTVYIAVAFRQQLTVRSLIFQGNREQVSNQAVSEALDFLREALEQI